MSSFAVWRRAAGPCALILAHLTLAIGLAAQHPCQSCHTALTSSQVGTSMANALSAAADSAVLATHPKMTFKDGDTEYQIERQGDVVMYRVQRGEEQLSAPLQWAFGVGRVGQTYVYSKDGVMYEARVSFYRTLDGLAVTTGQQTIPVSTITEAAGRLISPQERTSCFGCHISAGGGSLLPGIQCTACHAQSEEHALSLLNSSPGAKPVMPERLHTLNSRQMADLCGRCHRTYAAVNEFGPRNVYNVRFAPYRLVSSQCFNATDQRISCVACHNPHEQLRKNAYFYDAKCTACHSGASPSRAATQPQFKVCPVSTKNCTGCHMPKIELPETHGAFTDHRIRIVHEGEAYPG